MKRANYRSMTPFAMLAALCLCTAVALADTSNKWRMAISGNAESPGKITVAVAKVGAVLANVDVDIVEGTSENDIAQRIRDELRLALPIGQYEVETDDGEDVLIKKSADIDDFEVKIANNTVAGTRIDLSRE
jgi:hypothetical protein